MNKIDLLINKINKLLDQEASFTWEKCSYNEPDHGSEVYYGKVPATWNTWVSRIAQVLVETVKKDSEPYVYFKTASGARINGNYRDQFDIAKEGYVGALTSLKNLILQGDVFNELLFELPDNDSPEIIQKHQKVILETDEKKIFIVHGHDHNLKIELEVFLSHIGLKPIVLHRQADSGKTIIEKFESNSDVVYVFILLTPDEIAYTSDQEKLTDSERKKEFRARPNVLFEFGYFVGKLGRNRVCALHKGNVAIPSDLSGFIYKQVDSNIEEIGFSLLTKPK